MSFLSLILETELSRIKAGESNDCLSLRLKAEGKAYGSGQWLQNAQCSLMELFLFVKIKI